MKPVRPDMKHPRTNASVRQMPDSANDSASTPVVLLHRGRREEHDDRERHEDDGDRLELTLQVRQRAFLDRLGDLDHLRRAFVLGEHALHQDEADTEREQRGQRRTDEDEPLTSVEVERLVAAFGSQY